MTLQNMFGSLSLDATTSAVKAAIDQMRGIFRDGVGGQITGDLGSFRDGFNGNALDPANWNVDLAPSMVSTVANSTWTLGLGTTANATSKITSTAAFSLPMKARFWVQISQRIANQQIFLELVNDLGDTAAQWILDLTTPASAKATVIRKGVTDQSTAVGIPTTSTLSILELDCSMDGVRFNYRAANNTGATGTAILKDALALSVKEVYRLQIRVVNGATAPASNTNVILSAVAVNNNSRIPVEMSNAGLITGSAYSAAPVTVASGNITANANLIQNGSIVTGTSTLLAAGATYTGTTMDASSPQQYDRSRVCIMHTAGNGFGHLIYEESVDNATFRESWRMPIPADGAMRVFERPTAQRYGRWRFINGPIAQTLFALLPMVIRVSGETQITPLVQYLLSTGALASSGTFTSLVFDLGPSPYFDRLRILGVSDQASAANGLSVQQSHDSVNWNSAPAWTTSLVAGVAAPLEVPVYQRYLRVTLTNGATAQTYLRLTAELLSPT